MKKLLVIFASVFLGTCTNPPSLLEEILQTGELRVVTRNSPTTYYMGPSGPEGPEYDLMVGFARFLGVRLEIIVADRFADLIPSVRDGRAHIAAAGLSVTKERAETVDFAPAYQQVTQQVIYRLGNRQPKGLSDLVGKRVETVSGTSYAETLTALHPEVPELIWTDSPSVEVSDLLSAVADGEIDFTVADSNVFEIYRNYYPDVAAAFPLKEADDLAWALPRRSDQSLMIEARKYLDFISENGDLTRILDRYYGHTDRFDYVGTRTFIRHYKRRLQSYEALFREAAARNDMDWRLLAAVGYQESHWNPAAVSATGVKGIMMLTTNTASSLGVSDRVDPKQSIDGGARYLRKIHGRISDSIPEPDRMWFALAAYNVGYGHLQDARLLVRMRGGDPNSWIDVREALPLLSQRKWYSQLKYGYARGWEPVQYVENIRNYYKILNWLDEDGMAADTIQEAKAGTDSGTG